MSVLSIFLTFWRLGFGFSPQFLVNSGILCITLWVTKSGGWIKLLMYRACAWRFITKINTRKLHNLTEKLSFSKDRFIHRIYSMFSKKYLNYLWQRQIYMKKCFVGSKKYSILLRNIWYFQRENPGVEGKVQYKLWSHAMLALATIINNIKVKLQIFILSNIYLT